MDPRDGFGMLLDKANRLAQRFGARFPMPSDFDASTRATVEAVDGLTMTSPERIAAACEAVRYIARNAVPGAIVECGVWRGGSTIAMLRTLMEMGEPTRSVYLYDTFEGMPQPGEHDRSMDGKSASALLAKSGRKEESVWCIASLEDVRKNVLACGYPADSINFVPGRIEDTVPATAPDSIAILRLDTDWYESTCHELEHLYPRLVSGGVLIIDDYGHWCGARRAVDEFITRNRLKLLLNRIDYTGRIATKP